MEAGQGEEAAEGGGEKREKRGRRKGRRGRGGLGFEYTFGLILGHNSQK